MLARAFAEVAPIAEQPGCPAERDLRASARCQPRTSSSSRSWRPIRAARDAGSRSATGRSRAISTSWAPSGATPRSYAPRCPGSGRSSGPRSAITRSGRHCLRRSGGRMVEATPSGASFQAIAEDSIAPDPAGDRAPSACRVAAWLPGAGPGFGGEPAERWHRPERPIVIRVDAAAVATSPAVRALVDQYRAEADAFVFLSGGAVGDVRRGRRHVSGRCSTCCELLVAEGLQLRRGRRRHAGRAHGRGRAGPAADRGSVSAAGRGARGGDHDHGGAWSDAGRPEPHARRRGG